LCSTCLQSNLLENLTLRPTANEAEILRVHVGVKLVVGRVEVALRQVETTTIGNNAGSKHHATHSSIPHQGCQLHSAETIHQWADAIPYGL